MLFAWLHRYPFFRLLGPLIVGIYCSDELIFQGQSGWVASCVFPLFCSSLGILILSFFQKRYSRRWIFGVVLFLFCFVLGFMRMNRQMQAVEFAFGSEETTYRMFLVEEPQIKERNVFCRVLLTERIDSSYRKTTLNHKAIVYLSRDSLSECLGCGDELIAYTGFSTPANNGNPDEFDYARFLLRHQVSAIGNVHTGKWRRISQDAIHSFRQKAFDCRERVLAIYRHLGFQGDDFAVLSALTVGYKEGLSEEIRESFSVSGSSHVLALSGLHIGFLYALLWFCLRWLPGRWRAMAVLRTLLIIAFLWGLVDKKNEILKRIDSVFPKYFISHFRFTDMYQDKDLMEICFLLELRIFDKQNLFAYPMKILEGYKNHIEGHIIDSKECFEKAIDINPRKPEGYVLLAQTLQLMSGYDNPEYRTDAEENYKIAMEIYQKESLGDKAEEMKRQLKHLNSNLLLR